MLKIAQMLTKTDESTSLSKRICSMGREITGADGVSLSISLNHALTSETGSDNEFAFLDEQQFTFGEGPTFDASTSTNPVMANNFMSNKDKKTWPIFSSLANKRGIHSMTAFPLRIGNSSLGVLSAYRKKEEVISSDEYIDGIALSSFASNLLIQQYAGDTEPNIEKILGQSSQDQSLIHLASGMLAEKLNISIIEALVRIRAHAYKTDLPILEVASQIVERKLNLER